MHLTLLQFYNSHFEYVYKMNGRQLVLYIFLVIIAKTTFANISRLDFLKVRNAPITRPGKIGAIWTNGIIPYFLDNKSYDHVIAMRVRMIMNELEGVSCIRFKPIIGAPEFNTTWLHITNPSMERGCMHMPRYDKSGKVILVLGLDCLSEQQVLHTLMHGIGFKDEVTHPQRDQYIRILWNNIQPAYHSLFRVQADDGMSKTLAEYDPMSVMQFHDRAFSLNGRAIIAPLIPGLVINPSDGLSQLDTMKLRLLFGQECKRRNVDNLLDMCKAVFRQELEQNISPKPSKSIDNEETLKQDSVIKIGNNNQTSNDLQNEDIENDDGDESVSVSKEENIDDEET